MAYRVVITDRAQRDIDDFARYCRSYSPAFWDEQQSRLADVFDNWLCHTPHTWGFFFVTGAPYRAYLFDAGERTKYWLVYLIDERSVTVHLMRFWNASRNTRTFRAGS